jgi:hypothetical protein
VVVDVDVVVDVVCARQSLGREDPHDLGKCGETLLRCLAAVVRAVRERLTPPGSESCVDAGDRGGEA